MAQNKRMKAYQVKVKLTTFIEFVDCDESKEKLAERIKETFMDRLNRGFGEESMRNNLKVDGIEFLKEL